MKPRLLLLAPVLLAACEKENAFAPPPPPPVTVAHPEAREVTVFNNFPATLSGVAEVDILPRVRGILEKSHFEEGARVEEGQLLFEIEKAPYQAALRAAEANLSQAEAALALARARANRVEKAGAGAVSQLDIEIARAEVAQAEALVEQANAAADDARINLSYTEIKAPTGGRVSRSYVDTGNLVDPANGTALAHITSDADIRATFEVPERGMIRFLAAQADKEGPAEFEPVRLELATGAVHPHPGTIDYVDTRIDPATRTASVRAVFPNPDGTLASGLYGLVGYPEIFPNDTAPDAVVIPAASILRDLAGAYVWVLGPDNLIQRRGVETGPTVLREATTENAVPTRETVILKGLAPEDRIVVSGLQRAREGAPVTPVPAPAS